MSTTFPAPGSVSPVDPDQFRALLRANQVPAPGQAVVASELDRTIADCGRLPAVVSSSTAVGAPTARAVDADGIAYELVEQRRQLVNDVVEHSFFQDIAADVWPGAVLQGIHLTKGDTAPIPLPRAAGTVGIVTDLVSTNPGTQSRVVEQPSQTTVGDTRRSLLEALRPQDSAGLLKTDYQEARTLREVSARLGVDLSGAGWGAEVDASLSQSYRSSTVIASIRQIYYSAVFEPNGGGAAGFLTPEVGVDQLGPFMGPGNPPLYVSTVHYGRALVITATAATSSMALSAALKAHWQAAVSAEVELDAQSRTLIESSHVRVYTIGAVGAALPGTLANPVSDLDEVYRNGLRLSVTNPGAPISFTCRHIADRSLAHVGLVAEYIQPVSAQARDVDQQFPVWDGRGGGLVNTNVPVAPGDTVDITASGQTWSGVWGAGAHGPEGWPGWRAPDGAPMKEGTAHRLIGRFGSGRWFEIGAFWSGTNQSGATGPLVLNINDDNPHNGDPKQRFTVRVRVRRRPAAAAGIYV